MVSFCDVDTAFYPGATINPYTQMLKSGLAAKGHGVHAFTPWRRLPATVRCLHLHWIEAIGMARSTRHSMALCHLAFLRLESAMRTVKRRGGRVVWTAHNARPHEQRDDRRGRFMDRWLRRIVEQVDVIIVLSEAALPEIRAVHPGAQAMTVVIPHQNYHGQYPPADPERFRKALNLAPHVRLIGTIGLMRNYKEIERGIALFRDQARDDMHFVIAGDCFDKDLRARLEAAAAGDARIHLRIAALDDQAFADAMAACDLFLASQRRMLNSGSVMAALSLGVPVLAAPVGALPELQAVVGADWLCLREDVTGDDLAQLAFRPRPDRPPDLSRFDLDRVVAMHLDAYALFDNRPRLLPEPGQALVAGIAR
jgi:glycosyltransferase involved in cell wall biosynthesis